MPLGPVARKARSWPLSIDIRMGTKLEPDPRLAPFPAVNEAFTVGHEQKSPQAAISRRPAVHVRRHLQKPVTGFQTAFNVPAA